MIENIDFDFAFSFAGEDRVLVEDIYNRLTADGINVFYDLAYQSQLVGQDLYTGLRDLYKNKGKFIVCFISEHYAEKIWTTLEFTAIKERLMSTFFASNFLIPIVIGETKMLDDIPSFIGFYPHSSVEESVNMLKEKINSSILEDNLIINVSNCIEYISPQIYRRLQINNIDAALNTGNEITINKNGTTISFVFSEDKAAQTPCILVTKGYGNQDLFPFVNEQFPSYIITWRKQRNLLFSIHEFDGIDGILVKDQPLNEIIKNMCSMIAKDLGGEFVE